MREIQQASFRSRNELRAFQWLPKLSLKKVARFLENESHALYSFFKKLYSMIPVVPLYNSHLGKFELLNTCFSSYLSSGSLYTKL